MIPEIACTGIGRNTLFAGLVCHVAAILLGMMSVSGADLFFKAVYPLSCLFLIAGAYVELRHRGGRPFGTWRFYLAAAVSVFPLLGPLIVLGLIYSFPRDGQEVPVSLSGLFSAILKLRANVLIIFLLVIILFLLMAILHSKEDPYFRRRAPNRPAQSAFNIAQQGPFAGIIILIKGEASC